MKQKLKILHINCNYMTTKLHQTMMRHLNNVDNIVFAPIKKNKKAVIEPDTYVIESRCINDIDRISFYYKQHKLYKALTNSVKNFRDIDCIHAYTLFTDGNIAYKLHKKYKIPYVVAIRDTDVNTFFKYRPYLKKRGLQIMKNAEKVFFLSASYQEQVIEKYKKQELKKIASKKFEIMPNGLDDYWLNNVYSTKEIEETVDRINNKEIKILFVGQIIKRKNIKLILDVVQKLKEQNWNVSFDAVGKIVDEKYFEFLKKAPNFNYLGEMNKEELMNCYRAHDIFVMPSKTETFGLVYAEAMSQGLPIIYTKNQGFDKQFENGTVGFSVDITDCEDIKNAIIDISKNYNFFYKNCINKVKKYDWNILCKKYTEIYQEIVVKGEKNYEKEI